jgi:hypothetical protein
MYKKRIFIQCQNEITSINELNNKISYFKGFIGHILKIGNKNFLKDILYDIILCSLYYYNLRKWYNTAWIPFFTD